MFGNFRRAIPAGPPKSDTETAPYRSYILKGDKPLYTLPDPETKVVLDIIVNGAKRFPNVKALGQRKFNGMVVEKKAVSKVVGGQKVEEMKEWSYFDMSPHHWHTFSEVLHHVQLIGSGFAELGFKKGDKLVIFAATCRDWIEGAHGAFWAGGSIVTAYDTLGPAGLQFSMAETESRFILTHPELLKTVADIHKDTPALKAVILTPSPLSNAAPAPEAVASLQAAGIKVITLHDLKILGGGIVDGDNMGGKPKLERVPLTPQDTACIMYTSGSTGNPKGVVIPHSMSIAGISSVNKLITENRNGVGKDFYLGYLPCAHILEFSAEHGMLVNGFSVGFGTPKTLTDASVRNCKGDIAELRPTCMAGVPMVWDTVAKGIRAQIDAMPPTTQKIFWWAFESKWWCIERGLPTTLFDALVFNKIKEKVGGRLLWGLSGGAALSKTSQKFLWVCLAPLIQGYGLTETCAILSIQDPKNVALGTVGEIMPSVEVKLVDAPDANYTVKNKPNPQGEVWVRGGSVMPGYYKNEKLTAEVMQDGWFMTGDIGEFLPDGTLQIIDRKKNLIKLSNGEYVALEKLESLYKLSKYVQNVVIHADMLQNFVVGIALPAEPALKKAAAEMKLFPEGHEPSLEELVAKPELQKLAMDSLKQVAKEQGLKGADVIGNARLIPTDVWTPQNGMLTAANKLRRKEILEKYKPFVDEMYAQGKM